MDVFPAGDTPAGVLLDARVGGSPFNVAIGLARLGQAVAFLGAISTDFLGERLVQGLHNEGVETALVTRVDAPTTLGLVGSSMAGIPSYTFHGEHGADRQLALDTLRWPAADVAAIHVGSFATVVEPVAGTLRTLVERRMEHALISYDANARPTVEPDVERWRAALWWHMRHTDLLKLSDEDLQWLHPGLQPDELAARALSAGTRLVVVTRGADGATAWTAAGRVSVAASRVPVVDTVGAGDAFQAALLARLATRGRLARARVASLAGDELLDVLRYAAGAAAVACSRRGADLPRREELAE